MELLSLLGSAPVTPTGITGSLPGEVDPIGTPSDNACWGLFAAASCSQGLLTCSLPLPI